jgi:hypothetical protein
VIGGRVTVIDRGVTLLAGDLLLLTRSGLIDRGVTSLIGE